MVSEAEGNESSGVTADCRQLSGPAGFFRAYRVRIPLSTGKPRTAGNALGQEAGLEYVVAVSDTESSVSGKRRQTLQEVARRLVWWLPPDEALADSKMLVAQVMSFGSFDDIAAVCAQLGSHAFREVFDNPPPGVFSARRWNYWLIHYRADESRQLPERTFR